MRLVKYATVREDELEDGLGRTVQIGSICCTLFRSEGVVHAVGSHCPHLNASLDRSRLIGGEVMCRMHGYRFRLKDGACTTIGGYGLPVYPVEIEDGVVVVSCWED